MLSSTELMAEAQAKVRSRSWQVARYALRVIVILCLAGLFGWVLQLSVTELNRNPQPAGFGRGMLDGALMPLAFPNLLVGRDMPIYTQRNTGVPYKLGYTLGVNACGALFFGVVFWRISRLRRRMQANSTSAAAGSSHPGPQ
jgi:hypothetical protein